MMKPKTIESTLYDFIYIKFENIQKCYMMIELKIVSHYIGGGGSGLPGKSHTSTFWDYKTVLFNFCIKQHN